MTFHKIAIQRKQKQIANIQGSFCHRESSENFRGHLMIVDCEATYHNLMLQQEITTLFAAATVIAPNAPKYLLNWGQLRLSGS